MPSLDHIDEQLEAVRLIDLQAEKLPCNLKAVFVLGILDSNNYFVLDRSGEHKLSMLSTIAKQTAPWVEGFELDSDCYLSLALENNKTLAANNKTLIADCEQLVFENTKLINDTKAELVEKDKELKHFRQQCVLLALFVLLQAVVYSIY